MNDIASSPDPASILDAMGSPLFACDTEGIVRVFNRAAELTLGWRASEIVGRHSPELWHDRDELRRFAVQQNKTSGHENLVPTQIFLALAKGTGSANDSTWTYIRKDGSRFLGELLVSPTSDLKGVVNGYVGTVVELSDRRIAEHECDRLFNLSLDILCVCGPDGYFKRINPSFSRILGWSDAELLSRPYLELVHPDDRDITKLEVQKQVSGEPTLTFENRYQCKDGSWKILSWTSVPQPDGMMFATARDVTDFRLAEENLRRNQQDLAFTLRSIGDGVIATDVQRRITRMNLAAEQLTGWSEAEALGVPIDEVFVIVHEVTRKEAVIPVDDVLATGTVHGLANHTVLIARNGDERPISDSAAPIHDRNGSITGVVLVFRDASKDRDFEQELQNLNASLEATVARRTESLEKERRWLRNGNLVLESIASDATVFKTLELVVRFVAEESNTIRSGILLYDALYAPLRIGAHRNLPDSFDTVLLEPPCGKPANWIWRAILTGKRTVIESFSNAEAKAAGGTLQAGWVEPIISGNGTVLGGFITYSENSGPPAENDIACVRCACGLARLAIEHASNKAAIRLSEARYRTLLERIPAPVFVYDRETLEYIAVSNRAVAEYGYSREELMQMTLADIRPEEDVGALRSMLSEATTAYESRGVWRHRKKDGSLIDVEITTHGLDLEGRAACIVLANNVTEKIIAENSLRRSEAINQAILQSTLDCIVTMNEEGVIVEFNRAAEQAFRCSRAEALGKYVIELLVPKETRRKHSSRIPSYLSTGKHSILFKRVRTSALNGDGERFPVELTVVPVIVGGEKLFTAFLRDLTTTQIAEQELHRKTELLQAISDGTTDAIFAKDLQGRYLFFNRAASELTKRHAGEVLTKDDTFVFGNESGQIAMDNDRLVMQSGQPLIIEEELAAGGTTRIYHAMKAPLRDSEGKVAGIIGISRDITDRKRMESELRAREERYRSIVEHSPDMTFINRGNRITFINQAGIELLGASSEADILGRSPLEFFHPDDHAQIRQRIDTLVSTPATAPIVEERLIVSNGRTVHIDVQASSYVSEGQIEIQVVCRDITARKSAELILKRNVRHASFSAAIGLALSQMQSLSEMLQSCADAMVTHLDAGYARVWTMKENDDSLELLASAGPCKQLDRLLSDVEVGQNTIGKIASNKTPFLSDSLEKDLEIGDRRWAKSKGQVSFAGYPLLTDGHCVGVLAIFASEPLANDALDYLAMAANGMAQSIERKEAETRLAELNTTLEKRVIDRTFELELSEQFKRATLDALSTHIAVIDHNGYVISTNAAWKDFAQESLTPFLTICEQENYLAECDVAAMRGDADAKTIATGLRDVLSGKQTAFSHEYACKTQTQQCWFTCHVTIGYINHQPYAVAAHKDITTIRQTQAELLDAKEKAIQASLAKSQFLAAMSHELRTPLNGILGMNALLLRTELDERQKRFVEACQSSGKVLTQLINDVLDLSKIEAGKLELDPRECELEPVIYDVVDVLSVTAEQKGISLSCRLTRAACITARVDDNRLRQILFNLVGNSIKFTSAGEVSIIGNRIDRLGEGSRLRIEITDTGIGIPKERVDRLFKAFSQVDSSTTRQFGGTGLGLFICQQLVDLMGGKIGVSSQVGVGSTFWFEIPLENYIPHVISTDKWSALAGTSAITFGCSSEQRDDIAECMANWDCDCEHASSLGQCISIVKRLVKSKRSPVILIASSIETESERILAAQLIDLCRGCIVAIEDKHENDSSERFKKLGIRTTLPAAIRPSTLFETLTALLLQKGHAAVEPSLPVRSTSLLNLPPLNRHVLVAEDNKINQMYIVELLKQFGCTCDVVENGAEALSALETGHYDLVLMDCQMPEMDGYTAATEIRRREATSNAPRRLPILALTANALQRDRELCLQAGMDDYLKKPINISDLRSALESIFAFSPPGS